MCFISSEKGGSQRSYIPPVFFQPLVLLPLNNALLMFAHEKETSKPPCAALLSLEVVNS